MQLVFVQNFIVMKPILLLDLKKALRLSGWELVKVENNRYLYQHPNVLKYLSICGRGNDVVSPELLSIVENQLGLCLGSVLA